MSNATTSRTSFKDRAHQQLTDLKASVDRTQAGIQAANSSMLSNAKQKRDEATAAIQARRKDLDEANARMKTRVEVKKAETEATVSEWKANREVQKLDNRADGAEEYASAALVVAAGAVEEAGAAVLDAISSRFEADEAKRGIGSRN